jgi:hypothetical protein
LCFILDVLNFNMIATMCYLRLILKLEIQIKTKSCV